MSVAFLSLKEAASFLGISESSLLKLVREGKMPISTLAPGARDNLFFAKSNVLRWKAKCAIPKRQGNRSPERGIHPDFGSGGCSRIHLR